MHVNGIQVCRQKVFDYYSIFPTCPFFNFFFPNSVANITLELEHFLKKSAHGVKSCILFGFEFFELTKFD